MSAVRELTATLYRFLDEADHLLYVGISARWPNRLAQHAKEKPWWTDVHRVELRHFPSRRAAARAEAEAIGRERPLWNVTHNSGPRQLPETWRDKNNIERVLHERNRAEDARRRAAMRTAAVLRLWLDAGGDLRAAQSAMFAAVRDRADGTAIAEVQWLAAELTP